MASFDVSDRLENHRHVGTRRSMTLRDSLCDATNRKWCEFPGPYHNGDAASVQSSATGTQNSSICHKSSLHTAHSRASGSRHYGFSAFRKYAWVLAATVNLALTALLVYLLLHSDRGRIPLNDLQRILATWGARGSPPREQAKRSSQGFTRQTITPIACHSHNDYQQQVPLYDALNAGCTSLEADVWLQDDDLFIGHEQDSLDPLRTLQSLYLDPLLSILGDRNPNLDLAGESTDHQEEDLQGIYQTDPSVSLTLLIDLKTDSAPTLPILIEQLSSLHAHNLLTCFDGTRIVHGPITVVASGTTDFETILINTKGRIVFFDAPLDHLGDEDSPSSAEGYNKNNSFYASASFAESIGRPSLFGDLSNEQVDTIKAQIEGAHRKGLKARYWDTPGERRIWDVLWKEKVDVLNVDDL